MRTVEATGDSVAQALRAGLATLLGCDLDDLEVHVRGPGVEDVTGRVRIELDVAGRTLSESSDQEPAHGDAVARSDEPVADSGVAAVEPAPSPSSAADGEGMSDHESDSHDLADGELAEQDDEEIESDEASPPASAATTSDVSTEASLEDEAEAAADFLEGLLDALDLPGDLRIRVADDHAEVELVEVGTGALIGRRGQTLEAIQELLRCALQREFQRRARVKVDVEGYRARRLEKLIEKAEEAIDAVLETGEAERLEPMDVFERKAVHHLVAEVDGLESRSQGREPARRVIIEPV